VLLVAVSLTVLAGVLLHLATRERPREPLPTPPVGSAGAGPVWLDLTLEVKGRPEWVAELRRRVPELESCFEGERFAEERLDVEIDVREERPYTVTVEPAEMTLYHQGIERCVTERIEAWRFPGRASATLHCSLVLRVRPPARASQPLVRAAKVEMSGQGKVLEPHHVLLRARKRTREVQACFDRHPGNRIGETLTVDVTVANGHLVSVERNRYSTINDPELSRCVVELVSSWLLPLQTGQLSYTFILLGQPGKVRPSTPEAPIPISESPIPRRSAAPDEPRGLFINELEVTGATRAEVTKGILRARDQLHACFARHLPSWRDGQLTLKLVIRDGAVRDSPHVDPFATTSREPELEACLLEAARAWRFPGVKHALVTCPLQLKVKVK